MKHLSDSIDYGDYTVGLLDHYRIEHAGQTVAHFQFRKHEEVFAYALLNGRIPVPVEKAVEDLWPGLSFKAGRNRLYETVFPCPATAARAQFG